MGRSYQVVKVVEEVHPPAARIVSTWAPPRTAPDVEADRVECGLKISTSIPATDKMFKTHLDKVDFCTGAQGA